jgi:hypothetical protein
MHLQWQKRLFAILSACASVTGLAGAQAVSLQDQLNAQYKLAKIAGGGAVVVEAGTILAVQKAGIKAMPFMAIPKCPSKFEDNTLRMATGFICTGAAALHNYFQPGNKVYPMKIEVNFDKAKITFRVVSCDQCNGIDPPTGQKGEVEFEFPKGYLERASAGDVEDTIGKVFTITTNDDQQAQGGATDQQPSNPQQSASQQQPAEQPQQPEPQTVQLGMTTDQVQAALGKPEKIFNVGTKQIYTYKDVKITFLNGKVSDVQ